MDKWYGDFIVSESFQTCEGVSVKHIILMSPLYHQASENMSDLVMLQLSVINSLQKKRYKPQ